jgi:ribosomal protein L12E/L44/L45/RPP1/RPP2
MEKVKNYQQEAENEIYVYAATLLVKEKRSPNESKMALLAEGLDEKTATLVISNLQKQIQNVKKIITNKNSIYGAICSIGGIVVTIADFR